MSPGCKQLPSALISIPIRSKLNRDEGKKSSVKHIFYKYNNIHNKKSVNATNRFLVIIITFVFTIYVCLFVRRSAS